MFTSSLKSKRFVCSQVFSKFYIQLLSIISDCGVFRCCWSWPGRWTRRRPYCPSASVSWEPKGRGGALTWASPPTCVESHWTTATCQVQHSSHHDFILKKWCNDPWLAKTNQWMNRPPAVKIWKLHYSSMSNSQKRLSSLTQTGACLQKFSGNVMCCFSVKSWHQWVGVGPENVGLWRGQEIRHCLTLSLLSLTDWLIVLWCESHTANMCKQPLNTVELRTTWSGLELIDK